MAAVAEKIIEYVREQFSICSPPNESRENIASLVLDVDDSQSPVFQIIQFNLTPHEMAFPILLSGKTELRMSRQELRNELLLVMGMPDLLYGVQVIEPLPIKISHKMKKLLEDYPAPISANATLGYLLYEHFKKIPDERAISRLIDEYFATNNSVEIEFQDGHRVSVILD